jgi:hypothetical protein
LCEIESASGYKPNPIAVLPMWAGTEALDPETGFVP